VRIIHYQRQGLTGLVAASTLSLAALAGLTIGATPATAAPELAAVAAAAPSAASCVTGTKAIVTAGESPLHPKAPSATVNASATKGKTIVDIVQNEAIGAYQFQVDGVQAAAAAAGLKVKVLDSKGSTPTIIQNMEEAIALHPVAIIDDSTIAYASTQLVAAKAAHIPVVDDTGVTSDGTNKAWGLFAVTGSSSTATVEDGVDAAAVALSTNGCTGTYVQYYSPTIPASTVAVNGVKSVFTKWCPSCKLVEQAIAPTQLVTGVGPLAQTYVNRYSNLKAFFMPDTQLLNSHASIAAIHWKGELIGYFDGPFTYGAVRSGEEYADVSSGPEAEIGWGAVDEALRAIDKQSPITETAGTGVYIVTKANVPAAPATDISGQYGNYQALYEKAWGVKS
jgi:ribose transport system substrate-binding protein